MEEKKETKKKKSVLREILEWVLTIAAAVVIALPIRAFAFEMVRVDGGSMNSTLSNGEIMFVTKFDYASTWLSFPWQDDEAREKAARITTGGNPKRFDVVICRYPGAQRMPGRNPLSGWEKRRHRGIPGDGPALLDVPPRHHQRRHQAGRHAHRQGSV